LKACFAEKFSMKKKYNNTRQEDNIEELGSAFFAKARRIGRPADNHSATQMYDFTEHKGEMNPIIKQFFANEVTDFVVEIILDVINNQRKDSSKIRREFEFNRYNVTLNFAENNVLLEDILDPAESGETYILLEDFMHFLTKDSTVLLMQGDAVKQS
jgi:hypothetical protein